VPIGVVCARLCYVFFDIVEHGLERYESLADVFDTRGGGMAIYGGIIGGALGIFIASRLKVVKRTGAGFFAITDITLVGVLLAQSIGRWGNFVNQEAYGSPTSFHVFPFAVKITKPIGQRACEHFTPECWHVATFFYESMLNLIGFAVLLFLFLYLTKRGMRYNGLVSGLYLIWYGLVRAILEPLRTDTPLLFGTGDIVINRVYFLMSVAIFVIGAILVWWAWRKKHLTQATKTDT